MNIYTNLARQTVEEYLNSEKLPDLKNLPDELKKRAVCFVSIHLKNDDLRGCIGTVKAVYKNLGGEIVANAIEAAFHDPRFEPIKKEELPNLKYSVDILSEPELIKSQKDLNPKKFGVILKSLDGFRTGLLLPNLEGIDSVENQIEIAREKAGIMPDEEIQIYRFTSTRYEES